MRLFLVVKGTREVALQAAEKHGMTNCHVTGDDTSVGIVCDGSWEAAAAWFAEDGPMKYPCPDGSLLWHTEVKD